MGRAPKNLGELFEVAEQDNSSFAAVTQDLRRLMERHAEADSLVCPAPNLYERHNTWEMLTQDQKAIHTIRGLAALHPSWVFCRSSAALILGLRVPYSCAHDIHVLTSGGRNRPPQLVAPPLTPADEAPQVLFHRRRASSKDREAPFELVKVDGVWVTPLDETILDCLQTLKLTESLVIADSYLAKSGKESDDLEEMLWKHRRGCAGVAEARIAASYADARAESGGESYSRARIIELGYEVPDLQVVFRDPLSNTNLRCDFLWRLPNGSKIAGELDGMAKYIDPEMTKGRDTAQILVEQNLRDTRLALHVDGVMHFTMGIAKNDWQFSRLLDTYNIPYRS